MAATPGSIPIQLPRVLIAGGHSTVCGGLETFIARAKECLGIDAHVFTETPGGFFRYAAALSRFALSLGKADIVWLQYGSLFDLAYLLLAKFFGKTVAVTPHLGAGWRSMRNPVLRTLCNRTLLLADTVFTLHKTQPQTLQFPPRLAARCQVMGTFLPQALLQQNTPARYPQHPLRLIHVARLSVAKGSFAFLEVCAALSRRGMSYEAALIGPAAPETDLALAAEIRRLGIVVEMRGPLAPGMLFEALRSADVLINLSVQDALPLTVMEAMLCGVAPVVTALPGTVELAAEIPGLSLVTGQDAQAAAARIAAIHWDSTAEGAAAIRHRYGWDVLKTRYQRAFAGLAAPSRTISSQPAVRGIAP